MHNNAPIPMCLNMTTVILYSSLPWLKRKLCVSWRTCRHYENDDEDVDVDADAAEAYDARADDDNGDNTC